MTYPFTTDSSEHDRLLAQGTLIDPLTRGVLQEAGLGPGMRVLDLGSGAGNVARIAADLVGPTGHVVGIESDPATVELARHATDASYPSNVEYRVGDIQKLDGIDDAFDAVVGRLVLMYVTDAAATLRRAASRVRPGGVVCMQEIDVAYRWVGGGTTPLWDAAHRWVNETLETAGADGRLGPRLFTAFRAAGLSGPELRMEAVAAGGPDAPAWGWANIIAGLLPLMERLGVTTRTEVDPTTLADRLLADALAHDACVIGPIMTGAWVRRG